MLRCRYRAIADLIVPSLGLLAAVPAAAAVYEVRPNGTGDFPTIQAAIDASSDNDVIELTNGMFIGPGNRDLDYSGKSITVRSRSGDPSNCVIQCSRVWRGVRFESGETNAAVLEGVLISEGFAAEGPGGGILADGGSPTIRNCAFYACGAAGGTGGAIACGGTTLVTGCRFVNCWASESHGGTISAGDGATVEYCDFLNGGGNEGIETGVSLQGSALMRSCVIAGSEDGAGSGTGIGVRMEGTTAMIDCVVSGGAGSSATSFGGGVMSFSGTPLIAGCTISGNTAHVGGGIHVVAGSLRIERTIVWGNCATSGPEIYSSSGAIVTIVCCAVDPVGIEGPGSITFLGEGVDSDPMLCFPISCELAPTRLGEYNLQVDSPCTVGNSPCGSLIGALPPRCAGPVPVEGTSWGRIKHRLR